jgi:prepilin peptidase CpaA
MTWLQPFHLTFMLAAALLLVTAAVYDARSFRIPNWIWMGVIALFPFYVLSDAQEMEWLHHVGVFAVVLLVGFALFAGNFAGAGDVKMLAAIALWVGPNFIGVLLVMTALSGGVLALGYALTTWLRLRLQPQAATASGGMMQVLTKTAIPYGVAIACGGLTSLGMMAAALF